MRIGIFGGSFDPIHIGHLLLAEQCLEAAELEKLFFVPASIPPHKLDVKLAPNDVRLEMIKLAIGGNENFEIDTCELDRDGTSFTVETLQSFRSRFPDDDLFFLMGADSLDEFHTWKLPDEICKLATPLVVERPGSAKVNLDKLADYCSNERLDQIKKLAIASRQIEISSTSIRNDIKQGKSIRYQTTKAVERLIIEKKLYLD